MSFFEVIEEVEPILDWLIEEDRKSEVRLANFDRSWPDIKIVADLGSNFWLTITAKFPIKLNDFIIILSSLDKITSCYLYNDGTRKEFRIDKISKMNSKEIESFDIDFRRQTFDGSCRFINDEPSENDNPKGFVIFKLTGPIFRPVEILDSKSRLMAMFLEIIKYRPVNRFRQSIDIDRLLTKYLSSDVRLIIGDYLCN